jgi:hypothetical protein
MPDETANDLQSAWKSQPEENAPVNVEDSLNHRADELHWRTRSEILGSIASLFFVAVTWPIAPVHRGIQQYGYATAVVWVVVSLVWFRRRIWSRDASTPDAMAANGLEHYRRELQTRRDHLRNAWIWHGPLVLACVIFALTLAERGYPGAFGVQSLAPLAVFLVAWTVFRIRTRLRMARQIDEELKDLDGA